jgi:uncharacterized membrane protein YdjX (TVP38/TMEM64 family)
MRRILLLVVLVVVSLAAFWLVRDVGWDSLGRHQSALRDWVGAHTVLAAVLFVGAYVVTAALSLPHAALLSVTGGLLFGVVAGTALSVVGATAGAALLLVVLRSVLGRTLARQRGRIPAAMRSRLERDGFLYLLAIRLVPLFPFWLVNLAAAVAGVRLAVFVPATLLGILPASAVLASIGAAAGEVLARGQVPDLSVLLAPRFLLPLLALAALSLLPVLFRGRAHA